MALRAGYYGVKRRIWEAIQTTSAKLVQDVKDIWKNNDITGVKNLLPLTATTSEEYGVTHTVNSEDKTVTVSGGNTTSSQHSFTLGVVTLPAGDYIISGLKNNGGYSSYWLNLYNLTDSANVKDVKSADEEIKFTLTATKQLRCNMYYAANYTFTAPITIYPMIRRAIDPNPDYAPYAMTNQELTASANDQKTAINAIITAATGAADFAAFKAAMEAISPVTRSAAPDERSLDVEEPEVVKKTTRKKITKTEEEE